MSDNSNYDRSDYGYKGDLGFENDIGSSNVSSGAEGYGANNVAEVAGPGSEVSEGHGSYESTDSSNDTDEITSEADVPEDTSDFSFEDVSTTDVGIEGSESQPNDALEELDIEDDGIEYLDTSDVEEALPETELSSEEIAEEYADNFEDGIQDDTVDTLDDISDADNFLESSEDGDALDAPEDDYTDDMSAADVDDLEGTKEETTDDAEDSEDEAEDAVTEDPDSFDNTEDQSSDDVISETQDAGSSNAIPVTEQGTSGYDGSSLVYDGTVPSQEVPETLPEEDTEDIFTEENDVSSGEIESETDDNSTADDNSVSTMDTSLASFEQDNWDSLTISEQELAIKNLGDAVAEDLGLTNKPGIEFYSTNDSSDFGYYSEDHNSININNLNMMDARETADTVAHESRHCWQHERAENPQNEQDLEFKENFEDYIDPDDDYQAYREQPIEADARAYAESICERIGA